MARNEACGKLCTFNIKPGQKENSIFFNDGYQLRVKYKKDDYFTRIGNDLHGSFGYPKRVENSQVKPFYINGDYLESQIDVIDGKEYEFENLGFYDSECPEQRGKFIVHVSITN